MDSNIVDDIARQVVRRSLLSFSGHKRALLRSRLHERRARLGLPDLATYRELLRGSADEELQLLDLLTTKETSFFRNPGQFGFLMDTIVPRLEREKGEEIMRSWGAEQPRQPRSFMRLRILCAGCSTGEEPYSVAMALLDSLRYPRAWDIEILAGDLNESSIRVAAAGFYGEERLKGVAQRQRVRYMEDKPGGAVIRDQVRRLVRFTQMNLGDIIGGVGFPGTADDFPGFDMIFCRNVMIYFPVASQQALVNVLHRHLLPGGYLFTGDAEPLHLYEHDFASVPEAGCLIYRKTEMRDNDKAL